MKRLLAAAATVVGLVLVAGGVALAAVRAGGWSTPAAAGLASIPIVLLALLVVGWKARGSLDDTTAAPVPWADGDPFAAPPPERSDEAVPLSSEALANLLRDAGAVARSEGAVAEGVAEVRPTLQATLLAALSAGGRDRETARQLVDGGEWTDDRVAASVLAADVPPPPRSLRERLRAWLFPERVVTERIRRAVREIAAVADDSLPTVPGQTAPKTVPVAPPPVADLTRGADGRLQRAADREVVDRGPAPDDPGTVTGDGATPDAADEEVREP